MIYYVEISTNQYFRLDSLVELWFKILNDSDAHFQEVRQSIYFQLNNYLCEIEED